MDTIFQLADRQLTLAGRPLLTNVPDTISALPDPKGLGLFLRFTAPNPAARLILPLGQFGAVKRFTALHRYEPYWMRPAAGTAASQVPIETQFLLTELDDGNCLLLVPLVDGTHRCCLEGTEAGTLQVIAESGDPSLITASLTGLFVAVGPEPYALLEAAAKSVIAHLKTGRLRKDKSTPRFVDLFGWCTWDAFYSEVSHEKVRSGLQSFKAGGLNPKVLILDDGWQAVATFRSGEIRLTGFAANNKFPGDLHYTTAMAKQEFGVELFMVWHAMTGYWGGVDPASLPGYGVRSAARNFSPGVLHHTSWINTPGWGTIVGLVPPEHIYRFFHDYHRHLRLQGVDGVKVDTQATLEGVASGVGGRVGLMQAYHEALEGSVHTHFSGELINCMSGANEMLYAALNSTVTRTSTDFWPKKPESHGLHLYTNAQVSAWFGEFCHPDWDMFQSGHEMGFYHAVGRAVGGCPVYVSDKPDAHNFELLRKLVLPDGTILRAQHVGRPTRDCLFRDPTQEDVLLKIFNYNLDAGVIGVFNARYAPPSESAKEVPAIKGTLSPADLPNLAADRYAVYAHHARTLRVMTAAEKCDLALPQLACDLFTLVPIRDGMAPIGLADMFNSAGAITAKHLASDGSYEVSLRAGGRFLAWSAKKPAQLLVDGHPAKFTYDAVTHALETTLPGSGPCILRLVF